MKCAQPEKYSKTCFAGLEKNSVNGVESVVDRFGKQELVRATRQNMTSR
jgi:hypothetical protein